MGQEIMAPIAWHKDGAVPMDRKDGRPMLFWIGEPVLVSWCNGWCDAVGRRIEIEGPWADVEGPET